MRRFTPPSPSPAIDNPLMQQQNPKIQEKWR
jgi:hypothetical protein